MTRKRLERIVQDWQQLLGLERWEIKILWEVAPETDGAQAEIKTHKTYDSAKLRFGPGAETWTEEHATRIVIHELLHALHNGIDQAVDSTAGELLVRNQADAWYERELEAFIDRVALRIYEISETG